MIKSILFLLSIVVMTTSQQTTTGHNKCFKIEGTSSYDSLFNNLQLQSCVKYNTTASFDGYMKTRKSTDKSYISDFQKTFACPKWDGTGERYHKTVLIINVLTTAQKNCDSSIKVPIVCKSTCKQAIDSLKAVFGNSQWCDSGEYESRKNLIDAYERHCSKLPDGENCAAYGLSTDSKTCGFVTKYEAKKYCQRNSGQGGCCKMMDENENKGTAYFVSTSSNNGNSNSNNNNYNTSVVRGGQNDQQTDTSNKQTSSGTAQTSSSASSPSASVPALNENSTANSTQTGRNQDGGAGTGGQDLTKQPAHDPQGGGDSANGSKEGPVKDPRQSSAQSNGGFFWVVRINLPNAASNLPLLVALLSISFVVSLAFTVILRHVISKKLIHKSEEMKNNSTGMVSHLSKISPLSPNKPQSGGLFNSPDKKDLPTSPLGMMSSATTPVSATTAGAFSSVQPQSAQVPKIRNNAYMEAQSQGSWGEVDSSGLSYASSDKLQSPTFNLEFPTMGTMFSTNDPSKPIQYNNNMGVLKEGDLASKEIKKAVCHYRSSLADEITITMGDPVLIEEIYDDGWARGINLSTNKHGIFPMVCFQSDLEYSQVSAAAPSTRISSLYETNKQ